MDSLETIFTGLLSSCEICDLGLAIKTLQNESHPGTESFFLPPISYILPRGHTFDTVFFPDCYSEMGLGRGVLVPESPISQIPKGPANLPWDCEKHEACFIITRPFPHCQTLNISTAGFGKTYECFSLSVLSLNNILFMVCSPDSCLTF